jgi:hypothetical protein
MIQAKADIQVVFVRGAHKIKDIRAAIAKATGKKNPPYAEWLVVGLADDVSHGIHTGMPFSPPDDRTEVGFLRKRE